MKLFPHIKAQVSESTILLLRSAIFVLCVSVCFLGSGFGLVAG
jgi:hypothetical protein